MAESEERIKEKREVERLEKEAEKEDYLKYANEMLMVEWQTVLDSFDHALNHAETHKGSEEIRNGFTLIQKQLLSTLEKFGVQRIISVDQPFDPNCHQAIGQEESKDVPENQVIREMQPGYTLAGRVIRPAMVFVSK